MRPGGSPILVGISDVDAEIEYEREVLARHRGKQMQSVIVSLSYFMLPPSTRPSQAFAFTYYMTIYWPPFLQSLISHPVLSLLKYSNLCGLTAFC